MNAKIIGLVIRPLLLLLLLVNDASSFNVGVSDHIRRDGQRDSMFGFSITMHQENKSWVIVGAPKEDTSYYQPGVRNGGAVHRCGITDTDRCKPIIFNQHGNTLNERNEQIDTKSNQWFGATVSSAGINGPLVACAPRYVYHQQNPKKVERVEPVGTCFIAKNNFNEYQEFSPCRTMYWGYHRQGSCQAGLSAAVSKNGERLYVGAPGSWYWQGQMYSYSLNDPKHKVYSTKESTSREDDSYLGYSSVAGDFNGDGMQGVAVGMPRGANLKGKILLFSWNLTNQMNITGEQIGAYFGYSLCALDVDGDNLDDLIVGAPMHTEPNNEGKYETGLVYIIYQNRTNKFKELETRAGTVSRGRFGLSLAALGDINRDGYNDFAVGAPYGGPNGRGAVFIFNGAKGGPMEKASQVIYAEDVGNDLKTFGFSIAGGIDLDRNQYPDMAVGAYESNAVYIFKSRAVAVMEASTSFEAEKKQISLDSKKCQLQKERTYVTCTKVTSCLSYNGINLPTEINIAISWVLDSKKLKQPRMFFMNSVQNILNSTMKLVRGKEKCTTQDVYIAENIGDKLTPLEVEMKYSIQESSSQYSSSSQSRQIRSISLPVLDENRGTVQRDSINIMKDCGEDNICIPDLILNVNVTDKYIVGSKELLVIDVFIDNKGEDAFEASFYSNIPEGLEYKSVKKIGDGKYDCAPIKDAVINTVKCDLGNPLPKNSSSSFRLVFEDSGKFFSKKPFYEFIMEANSTNAEEEGQTSDNIFRKRIEMSVEPILTLEGSTLQKEVYYNITQYKEFAPGLNESDIGPVLIHSYEITNNGTSIIEEIELYITWPAMTEDQKHHLMYLLSPPSTNGNIECEPTNYVNMGNLKINKTSELMFFNKISNVAVGSSSSRSSSGRYNSQGETWTDERRAKDLDNSQEVTGDASYVHAGRAEQSSHSQNWQSHQGSVGSSTSFRGRNSESSGVTSQTIHSDNSRRVAATESGDGRARFDWNARDGDRTASNSSKNKFSQEGHHYESSSSGSSSGSSYDGRGGGTGSGYRSDSRYGTGSSDSNVRESSSQGTSYDSSNIGSAGKKIYESEYRETWNSSSVNGGPAVTHYASQNQTYNRDRHGGRVLISETSTETVITGGVGHASWGNHQSSSHSGSRHDNEYISQHETDERYQEEQQRYIENQRRIQEMERQRQAQERDEKERQMRLDNERRRAEEELQWKRQQEQKRQQDASYQSNTVYSAGHARHTGNRQSGGNRSQSSHSSSSSSSYGSGKIDSNFDENVHQDISSLAAKTHTQDESSYQSNGSGRRRMMSQQDGEPSRPHLATSVTAIEKAAQGGHGLQTAGLDLGVLAGRNNVDEEMRSRSSASSGFSASSGGGSQHHSSSSHTQYSSGARVESTSGHSSHSNDDDYGEEQEYDNYDDSSEVHGNSYSSHSRYSYTQQSGDPKFKHYRRIRDVSSDSEEHHGCSSSHCLNLKCVVKNLSKGHDAKIELRMRLVADTLHKLGGDSNIKLSTMAVAKVIKLAVVGTPEEDIIKTKEIFTTAIPDTVPKPDIIPLWIFVLAACVGALILLLLIYLLYKCGFFKRNRPTGSPHERQPLNRNGNYHGDEHL